MTVTRPYGTLPKVKPVIPGNKRESVAETSHGNVDVAPARAERVKIRARRSALKPWMILSSHHFGPLQSMMPLSLELQHQVANPVVIQRGEGEGVAVAVGRGRWTWTWKW